MEFVNLYIALKIVNEILYIVYSDSIRDVLLFPTMKPV